MAGRGIQRQAPDGRVIELRKFHAHRVIEYHGKIDGKWVGLIWEALDRRRFAELHARFFRQAKEA